MPPILQGLGQRKLVQWGLAYMAGAWLVLQVLDLLAAPFGWPDGVLRGATVFLALGFLPALVVAWYHGEKGAQRVTALELLIVGGLLLGAGTAAALVAGGARVPADSAADARDARALAVLPFVNMSPDPEDDYFSDGVTEELLSALAQVEGLRVASRTSSFAYRGAELPIDSIARRLGVGYVLQGSVRRDGDRLRIAAQLIDARTDGHVWSERYDREFRDVFTIQEEIARSIVDRLRIELGTPGTTALVRQGTRNLEAYDLYLRGRHLTGWASSQSNERAIEHLREAIDLDPGYALAHAGLADAYIARAEYTAPRTTLPHARSAAQTALDLDSTLVETRLALAAVRQVYDRDWEAADREFRRALEIDPASVTAWAAYADFLWNSRRFDEALRAQAREWELRAAQVADTLDPDFRRRRRIADAWAAARTGRPEDAVEAARAAVELDPDDFRARWTLGLMYLTTGHPTEAVRELEAVESVAGGRLPFVTHLGFAYARTGRRDEALAVLDTLHARADRGYVPKDQFAALHLALGDTTAALDWLEAAVEDYHWWMPNTNVHAFWDPLRSHPRFIALMRKLGAPPASRS